MPEFPQLLPAEVRHLVLKKNEQHQYPVPLRKPSVDHPGAAPFAPTTAGPAQLPDTSTARNDLAEFGRGNQRRLKQSVLLFIEDNPDPFRKDWGLYDKHDLYYAIDVGLVSAVSSPHMQCWRHSVLRFSRGGRLLGFLHRCSPPSAANAC